MSQRKSSSDDLADLLSDFDNVAHEETDEKGTRQPSSKRNKKGRPAYRSALSEGQTDRRQVAQATGKKATIAGQYVRRSFTFRPDQLERIEQVAAQLGLSQNDLLRWFTDMGIESVEHGEKPPVAEELRHRYDPGGE
jgi:hypothetical protein